MKRKSTWLWLLLLVVAGAVFWVLKPGPMSYRSGTEPIKAIVYHGYGSPDVLRLEQTTKSIPNPNQVLIKVRAAATNPLDWHFIRGTPYLVRLGAGLRKPRDPRLGADMAGVVESVGSGVTHFKPGDEVFGSSDDGAFAQYAVASEDKLARKPAEASFEQAAAVPIAGLTALQALRDKGHLQPGQKVLINGASGGVGTFAVQIAKSMGAEVTGVCSTRNADLVRSIGADHVIDYTKEDFTQSAQTYDLILDTVGNRPLSAMRHVMAPKAIAVMIGGGGPNEDPWIGALSGAIKTLFYTPFVSQKFLFFVASVNSADLATLAELMHARKVTPVIDRQYPLDQVPDAIRYLEQGHARGKVVIAIS